MIRRPPVLASIVVLLAVAAMVGLGLWQMQRRVWKNDLVARYAAASATSAILPVGDGLPASAAYRHVRWQCAQASPDQVVGGQGGGGQSGWVHVTVCTQRTGSEVVRVPVLLGWSPGFAPVAWPGGELTGVAVPGPKSGVVLPPPGADAGHTVRNLDWHIVADPPLAGLAANARPDPRDIPNNHWAYAVQWFVFAATALVIYLIALRRR